MVPSTSSISLTLENMYTETRLSPLPADATAHEFYIDGKFQKSSWTSQNWAVIDGLKPADEAGFVRVDTSNNMPTAAGLSSSSSGLSALVKALQSVLWFGLDPGELAQKSQVCFGLFFTVFLWSLSAWDKESGEFIKVKTDLKLAMIMLVLNDKQKPVSSREGMKRCMETSTNFKRMGGGVLSRLQGHAGLSSCQWFWTGRPLDRAQCPCYAWNDQDSHSSL